MVKDWASKIFLIAVDLTAFYLSLGLAFLSRKLLDSLFPFPIKFQLPFTYFLSLWWIPLTFLLFIAYERLYTQRLPFWDETEYMLKALTIATIVTFALVSMGKLTDRLSRLTVGLLWFYSIFTFPFLRYIGKHLLYKLGIWKENLIIVGAGESGRLTAEGLLNDRFIGYNIVGFLDDEPQEPELKINGKTIKVLGEIGDFEKVAQEKNVKAAVIAIPTLSREKLTELANNIQNYVRNTFVVPDLKGISLLNSELYHLFMQQLFLIKINNNLKSPFRRIVKRLFDLSVSISLLPLLIPLIGIIGIVIKLISKGPILFSHKRIGQNGKTIKVLKFRSMYIDAQERLKEILSSDPAARKEWERSFKLKNDPRITKVGKFLRKTSLDELPQIINVIKGEMSLVGPRPIVKEELKKYYRDRSEYYLLVKPGITGLWQVSGRSNTDYDFRVNLDVWYVLNWSIWLDIVLLFKTVKSVLKKEGAF